MSGGVAMEVEDRGVQPDESAKWEYCLIPPVGVHPWCLGECRLFMFKPRLKREIRQQHEEEEHDHMWCLGCSESAVGGLHLAPLLQSYV